MDSQYDSDYGFDDIDNTVVPDSLAVDDEDIGVSDVLPETMAEIVEDSYEEESVTNHMAYVEERSRMKVVDDEEMGLLVTEPEIVYDIVQDTYEEEIITDDMGTVEKWSRMPVADEEQKVVDGFHEVREKRKYRDFDLKEVSKAEISPPQSPKCYETDIAHPSVVGTGEEEDDCEFEDRDFDLNKLPTAGRWKKREGSDHFYHYDSPSIT